MMNVLMTSLTDHECLTFKGDHSYDPFGFFLAAPPSTLQVSQLTDVVDLDVFVAFTYLTLSLLQPGDQVRSVAPFESTDLIIDWPGDFSLPASQRDTSPRENLYALFGFYRFLDDRVGLSIYYKVRSVFSIDR
jgi:hypothetical protein